MQRATGMASRFSCRQTFLAPQTWKYSSHDRRISCVSASSRRTCGGNRSGSTSRALHPSLYDVVRPSRLPYNPPCRQRVHRRPLRVMFCLVLEYQPLRPFRNSGEYRVCLFITPSSQEMESPEIPGMFTCRKMAFILSICVTETPKGCLPKT